MFLCVCSLSSFFCSFANWVLLKQRQGESSGGLHFSLWSLSSYFFCMGFVETDRDSGLSLPEVANNLCVRELGFVEVDARREREW